MLTFAVGILTKTIMNTKDFEKLWVDSEAKEERARQAHKKAFATLSADEQKRQTQEAENSRLWEDYTGDGEPIVPLGKK